MSLEVIQQNARTIMEMFRLYSNLQTQPNSEEKSKQIKMSILSLAYNIQKMINEERQNAS